MTGCVYVITNKSMPKLIKVGYTERRGMDRAKDLSVTGLPHKYEVAYECLVENAYEVEQLAHKLLNDKHEGKEWFRTSINDGIKAIKKAAKKKIEYEKNYITGKEIDYRAKFVARKKKEAKIKEEKQFKTSSYHTVYKTISVLIVLISLCYLASTGIDKGKFIPIKFITLSMIIGGPILLVDIFLIIYLKGVLLKLYRKSKIK
jgi:hypothetical protein